MTSRSGGALAAVLFCSLALLDCGNALRLDDEDDDSNEDCPERVTWNLGGSQKCSGPAGFVKTACCKELREELAAIANAFGSVKQAKDGEAAPAEEEAAEHAADDKASKASKPGELVPDGSFESVGSTKSYRRVNKVVNGWELSHTGVWLISSGNSRWGGTTAAAGKYFLGLQGAGAFASLHVDVAPGEVYELSYSVARRGNAGNQEGSSMKIKLNGDTKAEFAPVGSKFEKKSFSFKAPAATASITFENNSPPGDKTVFLDDVSLIKKSNMEEAALAANLVRDGSFEAISGTDEYEDVKAAKNWQLGPRGIIAISSGNKGWGGTTAADGKYFAALQGAGSFAGQKLKLVPGESYDLTYATARRGGLAAQEDASMKVVINGDTKAEFIPHGNKFEKHTLNFKAPADITSIKFENDSPPGDKTVFLDAVSVTRASATTTSATSNLSTNVTIATPEEARERLALELRLAAEEEIKIATEKRRAAEKEVRAASEKLEGLQDNLDEMVSASASNSTNGTAVTESTEEIQEIQKEVTKLMHIVAEAKITEAEAGAVAEDEAGAESAAQAGGKVDEMQAASGSRQRHIDRVNAAVKTRTETAGKIGKLEQQLKEAKERDAKAKADAKALEDDIRKARAAKDAKDRKLKEALDDEAEARRKRKELEGKGGGGGGPAAEDKADEQAEAWHLAPPGDKDCDSGVAAKQEECEAAVQQLASSVGKAPKSKLKIGSGGQCMDTSWGQVPPACSAQTGKSWTAHFKTDGPACESYGKIYQLVCSGKTKAKAWHLAPPGEQACDSGVPANKDECEAAVQQLASSLGKTPKHKLILTSGGKCLDNARGGAPPGCSAKTGGSWTAHFKTDGPECESYGKNYQLVCSGSGNSEADSEDANASNSSTDDENAHLRAEVAMLSQKLKDLQNRSCETAVKATNKTKKATKKIVAVKKVVIAKPTKKEPKYAGGAADAEADDDCDVIESYNHYNHHLLQKHAERQQQMSSEGKLRTGAEVQGAKEDYRMRGEERNTQNVQSRAEAVEEEAESLQPDRRLKKAEADEGDEDTEEDKVGSDAEDAEAKEKSTATHKALMEAPEEQKPKKREEEGLGHASDHSGGDEKASRAPGKEAAGGQHSMQQVPSTAKAAERHAKAEARSESTTKSTALATEPTAAAHRDESIADAPESSTTMMPWVAHVIETANEKFSASGNAPAMQSAVASIVERNATVTSGQASMQWRRVGSDDESGSLLQGQSGEVTLHDGCLRSADGQARGSLVSSKPATGVAFKAMGSHGEGFAIGLAPGRKLRTATSKFTLMVSPSGTLFLGDRSDGDALAGVYGGVSRGDILTLERSGVYVFFKKNGEELHRQMYLDSSEGAEDSELYAYAELLPGAGRHGEVCQLCFREAS
eukprot:TRINITY_DN101028_c0_g1_i1.p1 TRINITY_DN101028_c0_g1~~TRINITY_DN101028_c0_g1_i1.p1  ORF type:complete len:1391 (+),score=428.75 TRINITY_DN101028_c0_g1_i1:112-4284(+)